MADTEVLAPTTCRLTGIGDILGPLQTTEEPSDYFATGSPYSSAPHQVTRSSVLRLLQEGVAPASSNLLLPPGLLEDVTNAVWRMAVDEPCGFRGCVLTIALCNDATDSKPKSRRQLLQLTNDTLITHKINILLYPDTNSWFTKMARLFRPKHTAVASHFSSEVSRMCCYDD